MVEIIQVREWDSITNTTGLFHIRFNAKEDLLRVAKEYDIPFVFEKEFANMTGSNEMMFVMGVVVYWYK